MKAIVITNTGLYCKFIYPIWKNVSDEFCLVFFTMLI